MSWADRAINDLREGKETTVKPHGRSMLPLIKSGQTCRLAPVTPEDLLPGDVVLVRVKGSVYLHLVKAVSNGRFLIGNNRGGTNGWVGPKAVFGVLTGKPV